MTQYGNRGMRYCGVRVSRAGELGEARLMQRAFFLVAAMLCLCGLLFALAGAPLTAWAQREVNEPESEEPQEAVEAPEAEQAAEEPEPTAKPRDPNTVDTHQLPDNSFIYDMPIDELFNSASYYNGQTVQVVGEAIGDMLSADVTGAYQWVTLETANGGGSTVSIFMTAEQASHIDLFGAYGKTGSTVQVRGEFHTSCSIHDGLTDLHAEQVTVVAPGIATPDVFSWRGFLPGFLWLVVGIALVVLYRFLRERQR